METLDICPVCGANYMRRKGPPCQHSEQEWDAVAKKLASIKVFKNQSSRRTTFRDLQRRTKGVV